VARHLAIGDCVDRGPDSRGVLDFMIELGESHQLVPLRGNHEIMMLDSRQQKSWHHAWLRYGGDATLRSYAVDEDQPGTFADIPDAHFDFLENKLVPYYECETHFFVHAYADAHVVLQDQTDPTLYWRKYGNSERHCSGKIMVCGHTPQKTGRPVSKCHRR